MPEWLVQLVIGLVPLFVFVVVWSFLGYLERPHP